MGVLVFGGTTEGRELTQWLCHQGIDHLVCVATDYGQTLLPADAKVQVGRLDLEAMTALLAQGFDHVVDATHPYAHQVTDTIVKACQQMDVPYLRLLRTLDDEGQWLRVPDTAAAVAMLQTMEGNILLAVGAKEIGQYASLAQRCYPRVLPMVSSIESCAMAGIPPKNIIAMQGPFSLEMNQVILDQFAIDIVVSKYTGQAGGFAEKIQAAQSRGCAVVVIDPPTAEQGLTLQEVQNQLKQG